MAESTTKTVEEVLSFPILLSDRIKDAVKEARSFKSECSEVGKQVERLCQMLRSTMRFFASTGGAACERPVRRIVAEVSKNLNRTLTLLRKCKRGNVLRRVVSIVSAADFRKILNLLESSIADMKWLLSIFNYGGGGGGGIVLSLPPIASNDPIIAWVWSCIASLYLGSLTDKIEAANELASLIQDNDRNKKIIVEEGGISLLLKLLKEKSSPEAQIAAAMALLNLANEEERVRTIIHKLGVPIVVHALRDSPIRVQIWVVNLVARMAEYCSLAQEDFGEENVIRTLVKLLSSDILTGKQSLHSIVRMNKEMVTENNSSGWKREREDEKPEVKLRLKISSARALWMLAKDSVSNSKRITEAKGLLCLAKLVETDHGELRAKSLMAIMEVTAAAESNTGLRRVAFKTNSPAAKAVVDQLLRAIKDYSNSPQLQILAIRCIGSLARTFPAREKRVVGPLVEQLRSTNLDVAAEAANSLGKFACPENFLCAEHSKTVIEFGGVPLLARLLRGNEWSRFHGFVLLCYLAMNAGNSDTSDRPRVLTALEGADSTFLAQHPQLRQLASKASYHLNVPHSGLS